jgi:mannosyl-oligosaccharide alpha-1,2-mannosidase
VLVELANRDQPTGGAIEKMDHLACFAAGMFALGSRAATHSEAEFAAGEGLAEICWQMYARMPTGIAPEIIKVNRAKADEDFYAPYDAHHYLLRPEAAEAWFYLWRLTGEQHWRDAAWSAWQAIEKHCRVQHGYSGIRDVTVAQGTQVEHDDLQQSFFLAETLKYLYLIFMPSDYISFDDYVFNTEAHPLKIFTPEPWLAELL